MRLPFRLPEWAPRTTWSSAQAREVWEPRIRSISNVYLEVERELVVRGLRQSTLQNVTSEQLPDLIRALAPHGVSVLPLGKSPRAEGYTSASRDARPGEPVDYRCAITKPERAGTWVWAWERSNNEAIGSLLGYPACCRRFFERVWVAERWMDTTWPMAFDTAVTPYVKPDEDTHKLNRIQIQIRDQSAVNLLWRWHGVRPVSHLPCSFRCEASAQIAAQNLKLFKDQWPQEAEWMQEILSWPVKWTSLHGIAEITTPVCRTSAATDALSECAEVRYLGTGYPAEGVRGVDFPHKTEPCSPAKVVPISLVRAPKPAYNGFSSAAAMDAAHRQLLDVLTGPYGTVLDLGCGDGTLLSKVPARRRVGVERDSERARHARTLDRVVEGDCTDPGLVQRVLDEERPDLVIAQSDRNPPHTLAGCSILSYSYEAGAAPPQLVGA